MSVYSFRAAPSFRGASHSQQMLAALDQPMGAWSTFFDQAGGGVLESFGLGTAIRDFSIPQGTQERPSPLMPIPDTQEMDSSTALERQTALQAPLFGAVTSGYEILRNLVNPADQTAPPMSEEEFKASPYFRSDIPWDAGMTEDRAAALAMFYDARAVREFYAQKRPITSFLGNLAGQAVDPINYIPVAGQTVRAASVARFGTVRGLTAVSALDAAANTAIFGGLTREARAGFGDDVSWQMMTTEIAMGAVIGAAFGGVVGAFARRAENRANAAIAEAESRLATLENVQQSRIALNEAIDGMANDGRVSLSPNGASAVRSIAGQERLPSALESRVLAADDGLEADIRAMQLDRGADAGVPRRPVAQAIQRMGGIDPNSPIAEELRSAGITSRTFPGLFRREARTVNTPQGPVVVQPLRDIDNMPRSEFEGRFDDPSTDDGQGYVSRQAMIDALVAESRGEPRLTPDEAARVDAIERPRRELDELMNRFGIDYRSMDPAEAAQRVRNVAIALRQGADPDMSNPRPPEGLTEQGQLEWLTAFRKGDALEDTGSVYRVNRQTGDYVEANEIEQLRQEGRMTEDDIAFLDEQQEIFNQSVAYGRALEAAVTCLI